MIPYATDRYFKPLQKGPFIAVVITSYNRPDALAAVMEACFVQYDKNVNIIIADDASTANTKARIDALKHLWQIGQGLRAAANKTILPRQGMVANGAGQP